MSNIKVRVLDKNLVINIIQYIFTNNTLGIPGWTNKIDGGTY